MSHTKNPGPLGSDEPLPHREIVRLLRKYQAEGVGSENRVPLTALSVMSGLDRKGALYRDVIRRGYVTERAQTVLSPLIRDIEAGRLRFRYDGRTRQWEVVEAPSCLPPPQPRVIPADDFNEWARCQSCGCPRFSSFRADKLYFACDGCVNEADRVMLGAKPRAR